MIRCWLESKWLGKVLQGRLSARVAEGIAWVTGRTNQLSHTVTRLRLLTLGSKRRMFDLSTTKLPNMRCAKVEDPEMIAMMMETRLCEGAGTSAVKLCQPKVPSDPGWGVGS